MLLKLQNEGGTTFYLNVELIEVVIERMGGTSEIILTNGTHYLAQETSKVIEAKISAMKAPRARIEER